MHLLVKASFFLILLSVLNTTAFAKAINCQFKTRPVTGVKDIQLTEEALVINGNLEIELEKTKIRCGALGKRDRLEGNESGYQVILKDCSIDDRLEGHLIDSVKQEIADIECR